MVAPRSEQRNPYQGSPPRSWVVLRLLAPDGKSRELKLIADTGTPFPFVIGQEFIPDWTFGFGLDADTNFGVLQAAWFQLAMPELGLTGLIMGYASGKVVTSAKTSHVDFDGLAGLPFLRLLEFGGNAVEFWIRPITPQP